MSELKPCPWCGGTPEVLDCDWGDMVEYRVDCLVVDCLVNPSSNHFATKAEAVEAWNTRAERTCELEELARDMYKAIVTMIAIPGYADAHRSELEAIDDRAHSLGVVSE